MGASWVAAVEHRAAVVASILAGDESQLIEQKQPACFGPAVGADDTFGRAQSSTISRGPGPDHAHHRRPATDRCGQAHRVRVPVAGRAARALFRRAQAPAAFLPWRWTAEVPFD